MKTWMKLSLICPFLALSLSVLGLFAMRVFPTPWMGLAYGILILVVLLIGIGAGVITLFGARKFALEKPQILAVMAGTLAGWLLLSFLLFFSGKAYLGLLAS